MKINTEKNKTKNTITIDYENKRLSTFYFLPLLMIVGFVPLIVHGNLIEMKGTIQSLYWTGQQNHVDFFSFSKAQWIVALTFISLIFYVVLYKFKRLPFKNLKQYYIPLGIYALFVIISTIFSKDKLTAVWGFVDMYQGVFVLISYVLLTFMAINFINNSKDIDLFKKAFLFLIIAEGILGVGQYFGFDLFQTSFGKSLIRPFGYDMDLSFSFGPKTIYGTMFNTNFVGSFATLMLPLSIAFLLTAKTKKLKTASAIAVILALFTWVGCNSRAGYMGIAVSALVSVWLFRKVMIKHWKGSVALLVLFVILIVGLNFASGGALVNRIKTLNIAKQLEEIKAQNENSLKFEDIILAKDTFAIKTNRETLNFKVDGNKLLFMDENNNELIINNNGNEITINDERYSNYLILIPNSYPGVTVNAYGKVIHFYVSQESVKILGSGGRLTEPKSSPFYQPLKGLETIGSNRGYEWGATIPMLKDYVIIGSGPDNFPIAFNQDDFIAKLNLVDFDANIVVDKPHNMYLQTAINTGVISLLATIAVFGIYIISSLKLYHKISFTNPDEIIGGACLLSVIGYLSAAMFNDSVNSVAPLFWLILGIGISINFMLKKRIDNLVE